MANPTGPHRELNSTYFVENRSNREELTRLQIQDQMLTAGMGGVLPEQPDPAIFKCVLDVGSGAGGWLIETAKAYPNISLLIGVDISKRMVEYARAQAEAQQVNDRVEFHVMDALRVLEFADGYFDLVNHRCAGSFLRTWDWSKLLDEYQRVTRQGGVIRVTEPEILHQSNSPALTQLFNMFQCAMFRSGHLFKEETTGIIDHLSQLLAQHACQQVQTKLYTLEFRAGTTQGEAYRKDMMHAFRTLRPFIEKWGCIAKDYDAIYQRLGNEMQQSDFHGTWNLRSAWGNVRVRNSGTLYTD